MNKRGLYSQALEQHENAPASQAAYVGSIPITRSNANRIMPTALRTAPHK
jgi:hypothetical protein